MEKEILQIIASLAGSMGFAMLYNLRGKKVWTCGFGGMLCWICYLHMEQVTSSFFFMNMTSAVVAILYAELMARLLKTPVTVHLISAIIPLVPGGYLYYAMQYAIAKNGVMFYIYSQKTIVAAAAIACGIMMASSVFRLLMEMIHFYKTKIIK